MTSTLQQEASRKLRFSADRTMSIAQRLYENGYITYMRTDSTTLSESAVAAARAQATQLYGSQYVPAQPRSYDRKVKNAQEAHEAIRPAGEVFRTPGEVAKELAVRRVPAVRADLAAHHRLADDRRARHHDERAHRRHLEHRRGVHCSPRPAARSPSPASSRPTWSRSTPRPAARPTTPSAGCRSWSRTRRLTAVELTADGHTTSPPPRYTEASLIKTMEELGIGRPSTYATIIKTIQDRGYVWKKGSALVPSWVAFAVVGLLEQHFGRLVDYDFTAAMEDELERIAAGDQRRTAWLTGFYFGGEIGADGSVGRGGGLKKLVGASVDNIDAREVNSIPLFADEDGHTGRGPGRPLRAVPGARGRRRVAAREPARRHAAGRADAGDGGEAVRDPAGGSLAGQRPGHRARDRGQGRPFRPVSSPRCCRSRRSPAKGKKAVSSRGPGRCSRTMSLDTVTLEDALKLLSLPRVVGKDPESGAEITAQNGRYGPYLKKGTDSRSLAAEDQMFTVTLDEALKIYAEPKKRGRQSAASAPPLKEMGNDPVSGKPMVVKDGRFGPYVTDGEYNASLRKSDSVEELTDERAAELLAEKRAKGPAPKKTTTRKPAEKKPAAEKKTTAAKKPAAKKAPAKAPR